MAKKKRAVPKKKGAGAGVVLSHQGRELKHGDMLTIAVKDAYAPRIRAACEATGLSAAKLLRDAFLVWEKAVDKGHVPGSSYAAVKGEGKASPKVKGKAKGKGKGKGKKG